MTEPDPQRIAAFQEHFAKAQSTDVVELSWGFALLQRDFPKSYDHNRIVVTAAAPSVDILQRADDVLGGAGLDHRYISVTDDALGLGLQSDLVAAGYESETNVMMINRDPSVDPAEHDVHAVSHERLRPAVMRDWRVDLPESTDDELTQLADRMTLYERGAEVTFLAVFEGSEIAARTDLYIDRASGVAQIESLLTHEDYRGRGYAKALVRDGHRRAIEAGCELSFLVADLDDWPREWYGRLGYVEAHRTHEFTRLP
ncbi:MAG: GNAT family N-acetyltransferase [Acidimicrobiia bacterium]|nr:GNAT family N-acetyltransferase [Acidimicrobiia bacterium]